MIAVMTVSETRAWLHSLGLKGVRLPKDPARVVYVDQPGPLGGLWRIALHASGGYQVEPFDPQVKA